MEPRGLIFLILARLHQLSHIRKLSTGHYRKLTRQKRCHLRRFFREKIQIFCVKKNRVKK